MVCSRLSPVIIIDDDPLFGFGHYYHRTRTLLNHRHINFSVKTSKVATLVISAMLGLAGLGAVGECGNDPGAGIEFSGSRAYFRPNWTLDGTQVVFDRYVVDVEGTNLRSIVPDSQVGGEFDRQSSTNVSPVEPIVAYTTLRHGNGFPGIRTYSWDIVSSALDGSSYERLTSEDSREVSPIWSPDGAQIAFFSDRDPELRGGYNLFVMDRDGSNVRNLTPSIDVATEPVVWSPTGDWIAFWVREMKKETDGIEYPYDHVLHIIDSDGSNMRMIDRTASHLAWSPDGRRLAFVLERKYDISEGTPTIIVVDIVGEPMERTITVDPPREEPGEYITDAAALTWSEDGSEILFVTCYANPRESRVYSANLDGSGSLELIGRLHALSQCATNPSYEMEWSPDRSLIAVWIDLAQPTLAGSAPKAELLVIAPDGSNYRELAVRGEDGELLAANAKGQQFTDAVSACSQGFVVHGGSLNEGLVQDCETLLSISNEVVRSDEQLNWGAKETINDWDGVIVGGDPPRVTGLSLEWEFRFAGSLPSSLVNLTALESLSLLFVSVSGPLPPFLADLKLLEVLNISFADLSGPIPPELGSLTNLKELALKGNQLSGPIPSELGRLTNLEVIDLSDNRLSGPIPLELGNLTNLRILYLYNNLLEGNIPHSLLAIPSLESLSLEDNELTGCIPLDFLNNWRFRMDDEIKVCEDN